MDTVRQYAKQLQQTEAGGYLKSLTTKVKQMALNLTDLQVLVEEATNNEPWGPHGSVMAEISEAAYDVEGYSQIMGVIARRLQDTGELWRHVYKSMLLLEYMLKHGPQKVVQELTSNVAVIEKLTFFQYKDKNLKDYGENVRHRAKQLSDLIMDPERVRAERKKAKELKSKYTGLSSDAMRAGLGGRGGLGGTSAGSRYHDEDSEDDDIQSTASKDRGSVGVAKDPKEATRARIEAMKQKEVEESGRKSPGGKKLSAMRVDPKVSASLGLKAPAPKAADATEGSQPGDADLMGGLESPPIEKSEQAGNDAWNAFEDADDTSKPMAATEPVPNGDTSWANFESAPQAKPSDPVAELFALDAGGTPEVSAPTLPLLLETDLLGLGADKQPPAPAPPAVTLPAHTPVGSVNASAKPALPEDMFSGAASLSLTSQIQQANHPQGGQPNIAGSKSYNTPVGPQASSFSGPFGQQPVTPAFGQPNMSVLPRTQSSNADGTVDVRSLGLTGQSQVHVTESDPFAGLGF